MKSFSDAKRRTTQHVLQTLGVVKASEDREFQEEVEDFRKIVNNARSLQNAMKMHLLAIQKQHEAAALLSKELANFYKGTPLEDMANKYSEIQQEMEKVQFAAFEKLYQEKAISAVDELLWEVPELEEEIKRRKVLLLDYDAHVRKYESAKAALSNSQTEQTSSLQGHTSIRFPHGSGLSGASLFGRKKSETDLLDDVAHKKVKVEQAESLVHDVTNALQERFHEMFAKKSSGEILRDATTTIFACESHLHSVANDKLISLDGLFSNINIYKDKLNEYANEFSKVQNDALASSSSAVPRTPNYTFESGKKKMKQENPSHHSHHPTPSTSSLSTATIATTSILEIDPSGKSSNSQTTNTKYFGNPLTAMSTSDSPAPPSIMYDCIEYLEDHDGMNVEGLFRIPGSQDNVSYVRKLYDSDPQSVDLNKVPDIDCHDVGTLLKLFLRELPEPLILIDQYEPIVTAAKLANALKLSNNVIEEESEESINTDDLDASQQTESVEKHNKYDDAVDQLCQIAKSLPPQHVVCLGTLLHFLKEVSEKADKNKMNTANLATCFAPSLIRAPANISPQVILYEIQFTILAIKILIEHADQFPNPSRMRSQPIIPEAKEERVEEKADTSTLEFTIDGEDGAQE